MDGIIDNIPVGAMLLLNVRWLALTVVTVPVVLFIFAMRKGRWTCPRRRSGALIGAVVGLVLGPLLAFLVIGGGPGDLRYWMDWLFLAAITSASGTYCSLIIYLATPPR